MRQSGFTLVEYLIVMILLGVVTSLGLPRIQGAIQKTSVRSARVAVGTLAVKARAVAVQRGCRSVLHFTDGPDGRAWVTTCKITGAGLDTLGGVERVASRFNVVMTCSRDSLQYGPRGLSLDYVPATVWMAWGEARDSVMINQLGKVVRS